MQQSGFASATYPTALHRETAESVFRFFSDAAVSHKVDTRLVVNSCARGTATPQSDIDILVLLKPGTPAIELVSLEQKWLLHALTDAQLQKFQASHRFAKVHVDITDGVYAARMWDDGGGPDDFEVKIGNHLVYSAVHGEAGDYFLQLQKHWLPYYSKELRAQRLQMVAEACYYDLDHVASYAERGLNFAAFDYLYKAFREFLQGLFISRKTYPLSYNKWIKEQVVTILQLPGLYKQLPHIISVQNIESRDTQKHAGLLRRLCEEYVVE